jgi:hypothetical protein
MTKCCFVISPIGPRASDIRAAADNFMKYIVNPCVESLGLEFDEPIRADQLPEPGRITSQVVELLKSADLVVADLTGYNANVYYELSFRHAIGRPTIHMAVEGTDLPFDLAGERVIPYTMHISDVERAKEDLAAQIKRVLEPEYKPRNPILDAIGLITLEASKDPTQRALAALTREMQNLRGQVADLTSRGGLPLNTLAANKPTAMVHPDIDWSRVFDVPLLDQFDRLKVKSFLAALSSDTGKPPEQDRGSEQNGDKKSKS